MVDLLSPILIKAYISLILLGVMAIGGALAFMRGVAYLPAEASHAALGGVSVAVLLSYITSIYVDPLIWAVIFSALSSLLVAYAGRHGGPERLNAALAGALAVSLAIYAAVRAVVPAELRAIMDTYLISDILLISTQDLIELAIIVIIGLFFLNLFYNEFIYVCFDPEGAEALGLNIKLYDYLLFSLIGLAGGIAAKTIGSLLVFALILAPAATAREIAGSIKSYLVLTFILTTLLGYIGLFISVLINWPPSGSIALITSFIYIMVITIKTLRKE